MVFPPYNAEELKEILKRRAEHAFKQGVVDDSALSLAAAFSAQESGDARTAVMLLLRAGEVADRKGSDKITDEDVKKAKSKVEEELILNMISTLPEQQQVVLYAISVLSLEKKGIRKITGQLEEGVLFSGEIYDEYEKIAKNMGKEIVTARWYREYISELEMYGLILSTNSGKGFKGQSRLIKLGFDAKKIRQLLEKELMIG
jgi:cell division control protein 6